MFWTREYALHARTCKQEANIMTKPLRVFYSYSHKDDSLRAELGDHLAVMRHAGVIQDWHDRRILPGQEWESEIAAQLNTAHIVLLLISRNFISSRYCFGIEMKRALELHESGSARVVPVILRACDWRNAPFGKLKALPGDGRPVTLRRPRDVAFTEVAESLRLLVADISRTQPLQSTPFGGH
jgi:hypothetical protein